MKLFIPFHLYQKLMAYINSLKEEIGLLGKVHVEGNDIVIDAIELLPQIVNDAHVKVDHAGLAKFFDALVAKGEKIGGWKLWIHSHPSFQAYFSGPDDAEIASFDNESGEDNWIIALVINQKGEYSARLQVFQPFPFIENNIEMVIRYPEYPHAEAIYQEVSEKVHIETFNIKKSNWPWGGKNTDNDYVGDEQDYIHPLPANSAVPYTTKYDDFDFKKEFKKKYNGKRRKK